MKIKLTIDIPVANHDLKSGQIHEVTEQYYKQHESRGDYNGYFIVHNGDKVKIWDYECEVIEP